MGFQMWYVYGITDRLNMNTEIKKIEKVVEFGYTMSVILKKYCPKIIWTKLLKKYICFKVLSVFFVVFFFINVRAYITMDSCAKKVQT